MTFNYTDDVPVSVKGDSFKFQQILLNLLLQSLSGTYKGIVKIKAEFEYIDEKPYINVEIENSKFELHKKENVRIHKLTQESEFKKILETKVDINLKIAKILSNALGWKINFNAFKGSKYSVAFPS